MHRIGILVIAGRKASTVAPWVDMGLAASGAAGGWPDDVWAPSPIQHNDKFAHPKELTKEGIKDLVAAFAAATKRAVKIGFGSSSPPLDLSIGNFRIADGSSHVRRGV